VDALETLGATATFLAAERAGELDRVADEVFRISLAITGDPLLRSTLTDHALGEDRKQALLDGLLEGKATRSTRDVVEALVLAPRGRTLEDGFAAYLDLAAEVRKRSLATVTTAVPLDDAQRERLAVSLARELGREVQLQLEVDPQVIGGVLVRIGDEVIDGSTRHRLAQARRAAS
jgi:F-type H+-transporting ATPase subunit delta